MAIQANCPHCQAQFKVKDSLQGKKIRCKECKGVFAVDAEQDDEEERTRPGRAQAKKTRLARDEAEEPPRRKGRRDDDEEDDESPRRKRRREDSADDEPPRRRPEGKKTKAGLIIGLAVGGVAVLGGVIVGVVLLLSADDGKKQKQAGVKVDKKVDEKKPPDCKPPDPVKPPDDTKPPDGVKPPDVPKKPDDVIDKVEVAVKVLREGKKAAAVFFLTKATVDEGGRREVIAVLEPLLQDMDPEIQALARRAFLNWAGPEQIPVLVAMLKNEKVTMNRDLIFKALGKTKDERAADALAERWNDPGDPGGAFSALLGMGKVAEKVALKHLHDPELKVRIEARLILKTINTPSNALIDRTLEDLRAPDSKKRRFATEWLGFQQPDQARKPQVLAALQPLTMDPDTGVILSAQRALKVWNGAAAPVGPVVPDPAAPGGKMTLAELVAIIQVPGDNAKRFKAMDDVAKLKDEKAVQVLVQCLLNADDRQHAVKVMKDMGPVSEGPAIFLLLNVPDIQVKIEACNILQAVGTRASLPILQKLVTFTQKDKNKALHNAATSAAKAISSR